VNVNTAQQSELSKTRGLDRYKAKSIIEYRAANGPITSIEELEKVPGLDKNAVERVKPEIAFDGPPFKPSAKAAGKTRAERVAERR
jgi:competence ComEA-like helix-hairpin-helix protein